MLLLELELVQGGAGLGPVSLQEVGLLDKVHLQLFLQDSDRHNILFNKIQENPKIGTQT